MKRIPAVLPLLPLLGALALAAAPVDYTRRIDGASAVPEYAVAYAVPTPDAVMATVERIRALRFPAHLAEGLRQRHGAEIADPAKLTADAVLDGRYGGLNRWDYTNGVIMSGFLRLADVTGDTSYLDYNVRFYDFVFTWMPAFREREERTGKRSEFSKMVNMAALDHCGSISAALIKTQLRHPDVRYRQWIDAVDTYISTKQFRFEDGTLARQRPQPRALWDRRLLHVDPVLGANGQAHRRHEILGRRRVPGAATLGAALRAGKGALRPRLERERRPIQPAVLLGPRQRLGDHGDG
jgi:hypothetical protein